MDKFTGEFLEALDAVYGPFGSGVEAVLGCTPVSTAPILLNDIEHIEELYEDPNYMHLVYGRSKDGRWFFLRAGYGSCGYGCEWGTHAVIYVAETKNDLLEYGISRDDRLLLSGIKSLSS